MAGAASDTARRALSALARQTGRTVPESAWQAVSAGASGRSIMRAAGVLGIYWTADRADNASFVPAARHLAAAGVQVPAVLAAEDLGAGCGACLVTDLGDRDLLSLKNAPWEERRAAYTLAFEALLPLHRLKPDWPLQPAFDADLYRWEQEYFARHSVGRHLGGDAEALLACPALRELADWLAALPRGPVHRDCQSQNIMLCDGKAWLIDFQGMRLGRWEYDLASLIYDPYMDFSEPERAELLQLWQQAGGPQPDPAVFTACAQQRIMQALGAFANIAYHQGKDWYLSVIPAGLNALRRVCRSAPSGSPAARVAACLLPLLGA
ncbi:MAG: phosphotransferase [Akkermansia sp.]